jgi:hypothetical protein
MKRKVLFSQCFRVFLQSFLTIFIFFAVLGFSSSVLSAEMPPEIRAKKMQEANADLDMLAQEVAKLCSQPGFRGFLRSEIAKSKNRENIVELDKFLDRAQRQQGMPPGLAKAKNNAQQAKGRLKSSGIWALEGYDLYIPVEAHKKKWRGGDDFFVAFSPVDDEKDIKQIVAYSVRDGKRVFFDPNKAPDAVVLVIAPEEHDTHEIPPPPKKSQELGPPASLPKDDGIDLSKPGKHKGNSYMRVNYLLFTNDMEPWTRGAPEIKTIAVQSKIGLRKCTTFYEYSNLSRMDKENYWHNTSGILRYPFDSGYFDKLDFKVYEQDGGSRVYDSVIYYYRHAYGTSKVNCQFYIYSGDDKIGHTYIYRSALKYNYQKIWGFNYVRMIWEKKQ